MKESDNYTFLAIADVHLGFKLFNLPELAQDLKDNFVRAIDKALELKVDYLFVVGDLYDTNKPSPDLIKFVSDQVKRLGANGCLVAGIAGDHDKPINNSAWIHLSNMMPVNSIGDKRFVGYDYSDNSAENVEKLAQLTYKDKVEWIFLHGQVPGLFNFCAEKKMLDLKRLDLINTYSKLKGVILGDIHAPTESTIHDPRMLRNPLPYIGYCSSLGVVKTDEFGNKAGILYYNGNELTRVPFDPDRRFIKFDLGDSVEPINWVQKFERFFRDYKGKKPVFLIEYNNNSKHLLPLIAPLYEVGIVKTSISKRVSKESNEEETINIRSELKTNNRTAMVLKELLPEKDVYDLTYQLINQEDPTVVLDAYKKTVL